MRTFSGMRRPMGGFIVGPPDADLSGENEKRFEQQAEAAKVFDDKFGRTLDQLNRRMEMIMRNMQEVIDLISRQETKTDSLIALLRVQREEIQRILTNSNSSQTTQQLVDQAFERLEKNSNAIDVALGENIKAGGSESDGKSSKELAAENEKKRDEEIAKATTNQPKPDLPVWGDTPKSDTSGAPPGPANSAAEYAKGNVDQTPPFGADKTEGSTDARDLRPDIADPALGSPGGNLSAGSYNQTTGQFDTAGRPPVINPVTGQPVPGIVGGAPPSDTGNKDLTMPADAGFLGQRGDPATSPAMQQGLSGTGGGSNTSDPNTGHQANVAASNAPRPPVALDNAIGDQPFKDPNRPVGPVDQNSQPFDEVEAKRKAEQERQGV